MVSSNSHRNMHSHITDLRIYPIKSCRGISLSSATLTSSGLSYDRRWMFVDAAEHNFITIRQRAEMTLVNTAIDVLTNDLVISLGGSTEDDDDDDKIVRVPLDPTAAWLEANTEHVTVKIWRTETRAWAYTSERMQRVFGAFFGSGPTEAVRLVMKDAAAARVCGGNGAPRLLGRTATVAFPDVLPVLIVSEASLAELNGRLNGKGCEKITYERFRPNIIVAGGDAWTEDEWKTVRINGAASSSSSWMSFLSGGYLGGGGGGGGGDNSTDDGKAVVIDIVARCARCQVPNVDPDTAVKDRHEPWDTLMAYRRVDAGIRYKPCFGMLGCPRARTATAGEEAGVRIDVGMRFDVLATTTAHKYATGF